MTLARMQNAGRILAAGLGTSSGGPRSQALALLARHMPWTSAVRGVLGSWVWLFDTNVNALNFYRESIGLDHVETQPAPDALLGVVIYTTRAHSVHWSRPWGFAAEQGRRQRPLVPGRRHRRLCSWPPCGATSFPRKLARPLPLFLAYPRCG